MKIYEIVDATNDETYWTKGMFSSLELALKELSDCEYPPCDDLGEDYYVFEIREWNVDEWKDQGKTVAKRAWKRVYDDSEDDDKWVVVDEAVTK